MSLGYVGHYQLKTSDDNNAFYIYWGENWNLSQEEYDRIVKSEGSFVISRQGLEQLSCDDSFCVGDLIKEGKIKINAFCGVDVDLNNNSFRKNHILHHVLSALVQDYRDYGSFPICGGFIQ